MNKFMIMYDMLLHLYAYDISIEYYKLNSIIEDIVLISL